MGKRILIIEDEREIQDILKELLMDAGYEATAASDGLEGITSVSYTHLDVYKRQLNFNLPSADEL